jgi:hypothetical protein
MRRKGKGVLLMERKGTIGMYCTVGGQRKSSECKKKECTVTRIAKLLKGKGATAQVK